MKYITSFITKMKFENCIPGNYQKRLYDDKNLLTFALYKHIICFIDKLSYKAKASK